MDKSSVVLTVCFIYFAILILAGVYLSHEGAITLKHPLMNQVEWVERNR